MPRFDKTGPSGEGAMTGRRLGKCTGNDVSVNDYRGRAGKVRGRGKGFGRGRGDRQNKGIVSTVSEKILIENEMKELKDRLIFLKKELGESDIDN